MATQKPCPRCHALFTVTPTHRWYCAACGTAASQRVCKQCGKSFKASPSKKGVYCSRACQNADPATHAHFDALAAKRSAEGWVLVECAAAKLGVCSHPQDLIRQERAAATRQGKCHPECRAAFRRARPAHNAGTRQGRVLNCEDCGKEIGYRSLANADQKYCQACTYKLRTGTSRPKTAIKRACAACGEPVKVTPARIKKTPDICCSFTCREIWRQTKDKRPAVRCLQCGAIRRDSEKHRPRSVDPETMTWVCMACRTPKTAWQQRTCAHCQKSYRARIRLSNPEAYRFCSVACRRASYSSRRHTRICARCGKEFSRRQGGRYCSLACSNTATRRGRTYKSQAEELVREQIAAGVRGIAALARAARVSEPTANKYWRAYEAELAPVVTRPVLVPVAS